MPRGSIGYKPSFLFEKQPIKLLLCQTGVMSGMWKNWFKAKRNPDRIELAVPDSYYYDGKRFIRI